ncbi:MAG: RNA polymerase sigma-70 factor [Cyclobacteriaceae bacterium]
MQNDAHIVERLKQGDEQAFRIVFDTYYPRLLNFSMKFVHADENAKEIVQDVFLKIWHNRRKLNPQLSFQAYLFKIARHENFKYLKKVARDVTLKEELVRRCLSTASSGEDDLLFAEYQAMAKKAIALLPPKRRLVFEMAQQDLTHDEIAKELGISVHTVRAQLANATQSVKDTFLRFTGVTLSILLLLFYFLF